MAADLAADEPAPDELAGAPLVAAEPGAVDVGVAVAIVLPDGKAAVDVGDGLIAVGRADRRGRAGRVGRTVDRRAVDVPVAVAVVLPHHDAVGDGGVKLRAGVVADREILAAAQVVAHDVGVVGRVGRRPHDVLAVGRRVLTRGRRDGEGAVARVGVETPDHGAAGRGVDIGDKAVADGRVVLVAVAAGHVGLSPRADVDAVDVEVTGAVVGPVSRTAVGHRGAGVAAGLRHLGLLQHPRRVAARMAADLGRQSDAGGEHDGSGDDRKYDRREAQRPHAGRGMRLHVVPPIDAPPQRKAHCCYRRGGGGRVSAIHSLFCERPGRRTKGGPP